MKYIAYGSNLNKDQMALRCPDAKFLGKGMLQDYRLVFKSVADVEYCFDEMVDIGIWEITDKCLKALDVYEGYPSLYGRKEYDVIDQNGDVVKGIMYTMNRCEYAMPSEYYLNTIMEGYLDCNIKLDCLINAVVKTERLTGNYYE